MTRFIKYLLFALSAYCLFSASAPAQTEEENGAYLAAALKAARTGDWDKAHEFATLISDPIGVEIITWARLRGGKGEWREYVDFLQRHPDWPGLSLLRKRGEGAIPHDASPDAVFAYFNSRPPDTGIGILRLTEALVATGKRQEAVSEAVRAWRNFSMTQDEHLQLLARFGNELKDHHVSRLDMLLWRGLEKRAKALYSLVPPGYAKLARARLALKRRRNGVDSLIAAVPKELQGDPGLNYERFEWRARKGYYESARDLLIERSVSADSLGRPEKWANRRRSIARQEMRNGAFRRAYEIASRHYLTSGSNYADLEWLSGYIALRKLNEPALALEHFNRFRAAVATPISFGRAGYWQGRAHEALGERKAAQEAYAFAAGYQTSFYGQLAAEAAGIAADPLLAGNETFPDWREAEFVKSSVLLAAALLHYADQYALAERFMKHLAESLDRTGLQQLADLAVEIGRPQIAIRLSKQSARQGHVLYRTYYPLTDLAKMDLPVESAVVMSIARRESELDQSVVSSAGARGLMQVMPKTARLVARRLKIPYSRSKLTSDWAYNATIGAAYLAQQLEDFNGSYILAFAAYNAGPNRARRWIELYGDPRKSTVDQVDWIESIPFRETRNYVMRVMESVHVYRARISGKTPGIRISKDLRKG